MKEAQEGRGGRDSHTTTLILIKSDKVNPAKQAQTMFASPLQTSQHRPPSASRALSPPATPIHTSCSSSIHTTTNEEKRPTDCRSSDAKNAATSGSSLTHPTHPTHAADPAHPTHPRTPHAPHTPHIPRNTLASLA